MQDELECWISDRGEVPVPVWGLVGESQSCCLREVKFPACISGTIQTPTLTVQRTLVVDFVDNSPRTSELFVKCLTTLHNLHTLEIVSMQGDERIQSFAIALDRTRTQLQLRKVRTLVLPPTAHRLLRHCPNVEDLTCCATEPDVDFVESLAARKSNCVTKFSVLYPGYRNIWPSWVYLIFPS